MAGGKFNYKQYEIGEISDKIEEVIQKNNKPIPKKDKWDYGLDPHEDGVYYDYSDEIIDVMKKAVEALKKAEIYANNLDWLLSGNIGEETFLKRIKEELKFLNQ